MTNEPTVRELILAKRNWVTQLPKTGDQMYKTVRLGVMSYRDWQGKLIINEGRYCVWLDGDGFATELIETIDPQEAIDLYAECVAIVALGIDIHAALVRRYALHPPVRVTPPSSDQ